MSCLLILQVVPKLIYCKIYDFCRDAIDTSGFLGLDLEMKVYMLSEVTRLKSKPVGAGMWAVIFLCWGN